MTAGVDIRRGEREPNETNMASSPRFANPWWAVALLCLGYSGYFKGMAPLAGLPVDLTAVLFSICAWGVALQVVRGRWFDSRTLCAVLALWLIFGIGAAMTIGAGTGGNKIALLATVTLLCALAPCYFLGGPQAQRWWLLSTIVAAAVMAGAATLMPDPVLLDQQGRLNLEGATTIGTGRVIGAGILVAVVLALASARNRWAWWAAACLGAAALVAVGSRGPFLALLVSIIIVILLGATFKGRRAPAVTGGAMAIIAICYTVMISSSPAARRLALFFTGEETDTAREFLMREAWIAAIHNPLGLGWGGFSTLSGIELSFGGHLAYPHNLTLEIMAEGGWLAVALFVVLAFFSFRGYIRSSETPGGAALLGLGVYWFTVSQTSSDINGNRITWIALVLGVMMTRLKVDRSVEFASISSSRLLSGPRR